MTHTEMAPPPIFRWIGLGVGPVLALVAYALLGSQVGATGLTEGGRRVIGVGLLMAVWWLTEALPLAATSLVPLVVFPVLNITSMKGAAAPYAEDLIFLFLGGFLLGRAFEKIGLHRRVALVCLRCVGSNPASVVGGVMLATGLISMWVSNTATTIMMMPIGMSLVALVETSGRADPASAWTENEVRRFGVALLLGISYAASLGGMGTPLGTPPNLQFVSTARDLVGYEYSFAGWMALGVPLAIALLGITWFMLTKVLHRTDRPEIPGGVAFVKTELKHAGKVRLEEWVTLGVFVVAVVMWVAREWIGKRLGAVDAKGSVTITDAGIAVTAALALFVAPGAKGSSGRGSARGPILDGKDLASAPWGILLLFGGGLSLAAAMKATAVDTFMGSLFGSMSGLPMWVIILVVVASVTFLSELASNTAVAAAVLPVLAAAADGLHVHPYQLMIPATFAASCGFMLPVATPPNAIVFASGRIKVRELTRAGLALDLVSIACVTALGVVAGPWFEAIGRWHSDR